MGECSQVFFVSECQDGGRELHHVLYCTVLCCTYVGISTILIAGCITQLHSPNHVQYDTMPSIIDGSEELSCQYDLLLLLSHVL